MRILLLATAYNGLCQRAHIELNRAGHEVSVALALSEQAMREAVANTRPQIIICPFLKDRVPEDIWRSHLCIIIHPGIVGDRGPSSLDWAIAGGEQDWGVTALEAADEMDAGDIWASATFAMRTGTKASIYRNEVTEAGISVIKETLAKLAGGGFTPEPLDDRKPGVRGRLRPAMIQADRAIDWTADSSARILRQINAADSNPGVLDRLCGGEYYLFGAHREGRLTGEPGAIIAQRHGAICRATVDGAVWLSHLRRKKTGTQRFIKLPAAMVLGAALKNVPDSPIDALSTGPADTFREIWYEERDRVGYLYFDFYNGALSTEQCQRLRAAFLLARARPTRVIVMMGGEDFWSNGIDLNRIEASDDPAGESWRNINAIDDLVHTVATTETQLVVSAMRGNAGAGGVIQALAADVVLAHAGVVLNPHYKTMGLYGSEYWTYLLPRRVGREKAIELTERCLPIGARESMAIGLIDEVLPRDPRDCHRRIVQIAEALADGPDYTLQLARKRAARRQDERRKPLAAYRAEELARMSDNFYGPNRRYHRARAEFVFKAPLRELPAHLAAQNLIAMLNHPLASDSDAIGEMYDVSVQLSGDRSRHIRMQELR